MHCIDCRSPSDCFGCLLAARPHRACCALQQYEQPENLTACLTALGPLTPDNYQQAIACEATYGKGNYHNSMIALDMGTGAVR